LVWVLVTNLVEALLLVYGMPCRFLRGYRTAVAMGAFAAAYVRRRRSSLCITLRIRRLSRPGSRADRRRASRARWLACSPLKGPPANPTLRQPSRAWPASSTCRQLPRT